jgi:hypothetical protein
LDFVVEIQFGIRVRVKFPTLLAGITTVFHKV